MKLQKVNDEVFVAEEPLVLVGRKELAALKEAALRNPRRRARICAHPNVTDPLHEMLIVHTRGAYIPPHRHHGKSESLHVIEGEADAVFFDEAGTVVRVVPLGEAGSNRTFYYRLGGAWYHTLLIRSDVFIFHEITNGPFRREETEFASWGPPEGDAAAGAEFQRLLDEEIGRRS